MERGFQGKEGQVVPEMTEEFTNSVSERYIELYESITGDNFVKSDISDVESRINKNVSECLSKLINNCKCCS
jgi:phosphoribosylaminoimidazole-succinocarboxamide synthase